MTKSSPLPSSVNRLPNGSVEITFTIPWISIQKGYEYEVKKAVAEAELPGFRKGKAPKSEVEAKLDKSKLYSHTLEHLVPTEYSKAVEEQHLKPVLYPSITVKEGQEGKDWIFVATTCEAPEVVLPDELKGEIDWLVKNSKVTLPQLIVEAEADHRIAALAENLSKLGLTVDKYLQTKKITAENLRADTLKTAQVELSIEFVLQKVQVVKSLPDRKSTLDFLTTLSGVV
ncbi:MAG: Trigger factor [Candidatus Amesbacteria bacterium GW2011_GWA2_42_12]|uniref:Trigger factor n=1 Tax=Candidatus Amesbacteria bacterium GW2011_GWA2_42_12 TaxID=1618356 RepID=A0A0G0Y764_9BACT|nr:MAG: Trigger factor [Candidatus Amesbacteria bacterium GW2011_GWA2_42_12]